MATEPAATTSPASQFGTVFRFELAFHGRQPLFPVMAVILFLMSFGATVSDNIQVGGVMSNININAPFNVIAVLGTLSFITALVAGVAFTASPILRDTEYRVAELFLTTGVRKLDYLLGRFCGAFVFCVLVYCACLAGVLLGEFMPWLDPERLGPLRLDAYWFVTWAIALPNMLFVCALVFLVATLTRSLTASYVVVVAILALSAAISSLVDPEQIRLLSMLDPFGEVAIQDITRYWTPFQRNELVVPLEGNFLINRIMVLLLPILCLVAACRRFGFSLDTGRKSKRRSPRAARVTAAAPPMEAPVDLRRQFNTIAQVHQFFSLTRMEVRNILIGKTFLLMVLLGMLQIFFNALLGLESFYGTAVYPTTGALLQIINGAYSLPLLVVLIFYSSELLARDRQVGISEMLDAMPWPNFVIIGAKLCALALVMAVMLLAAIVTGLLVQLFSGYYVFELKAYLLGLFSFFQFPIWFTCVLAVFAQVITGQRYLGMLVVVLFLIGQMFLPQQGFDHHLYLFTTPPIPYSVFTGFNPNIEAWWWISLYWGLFCVLLVIAMHLLWQRGSDSNRRFSPAALRARFTPQLRVLSLACLTGFIGCGAYIYYNTNVLNPRLTSLDREQQAADYEKNYQAYAALDFPDVEAVYAEVDIFPQQREARIAGRYTLRNNESVALGELHLSIASHLAVQQMDIPGAELSLSDPKLGYHIYRLEPPLPPGAALQMSFVLDWLTPGFVNRSPHMGLLGNGTFFNNTQAFPMIGYQKDVELIDNNRRRRYDLPPVQRMAPIDDPRQRNVALGARQRTTFEAIVSTSEDQIAVTPGYLVDQWQASGRQYFHYRMDTPIWPFVAFLSADYEVRRDRWNEVELEVYYHHGVNVDRMLEASKKSLDYFTGNFSPYQYRQFRIFEFPVQHGTFAQSFPNTIPFSEAIGFVADIRDPANIDYVFYVTAHELAHQWWGHQVAGANVQGSSLLIETLSQYSALMVMEQEYGTAHMQRFLKYELDRYLGSRGSEVLEEMPLMLVENQGYIHYRKGSLVMYALKDYLGEETVNGVLREFLADFAFQGPPYPTSRDLVARLRQAAGPRHQDLITDLFEKIVLFDLRVDSASQEALPDGRYRVSLQTSASKFEADGQGQETRVPVDLLMDIAVLGEPDPVTGVPGIIHLEKMRVSGDTQTFSFELDTPATSVGIDPFNKLIDRNPDDNVRRVD